MYKLGEKVVDTEFFIKMFLTEKGNDFWLIDSFYVLNKALDCKNKHLEIQYRYNLSECSYKKRSK